MLEEKSNVAYTIIVAANASDQLYASVCSFLRCCNWWYFRDGRPALIVYDDLSKQAVAYVRFLFY
jgi:F0F1-type ATP synthase alpha subunit